MKRAFTNVVYHMEQLHQIDLLVTLAAALLGMLNTPLWKRPLRHHHHIPYPPMILEVVHECVAYVYVERVLYSVVASYGHHLVALLASLHKGDFIDVNVIL